MQSTPDYIELRAKEGKPEAYEPTEEELRSLCVSVANSSVKLIATGPMLRQKLIELQQAAEQTIDMISKDKLISAGLGLKTTENVRNTNPPFPGIYRGAQG